MLSAWWLCLIIPASACFGYMICAFLMIGKIADETDEADKND